MDFDNPYRKNGNQYLVNYHF